MTDRWRDDPERAARIRGRLADIADSRARLEAAEALLAGYTDPWMKRRQESLAAGAVKGLDAMIGMALFDPAAVPEDEIAEAAGVGLDHVEGVRRRLQSYGP